ncbi:MAG: 50S ribosomal protein L17 [Firmicutes bacterium]|nr:50S ribosomal protein L17 [Bacillota bacterium]
MNKKKLGRDSAQREALFRSLTSSLIKHEKIETTEAKAKALRPFIDKMITLAKNGDLHSRRQAAAFLNDPEAVKKLFDSLGPRYADRQGGYTRITRLGTRRGDATVTAVIELV